MVSNKYASIIQDNIRDKVTLSLNTEYTFRGFKLTTDEEMILLSIFSEFVKSKFCNCDDKYAYDSYHAI